MSRPVIAFRYVFLNPPTPPTTSVGVTLASLSIGSTLLSLAQGDEARTRLRDFARAFMKGEQFLRDPAELALYRQYETFLAALASHNSFSLGLLSDIVVNAFGQGADELAASSPFRADSSKLADAIAVLTLASSAKSPRLLSETVRLYRAIDLISKIAASDPSIEGLKRRIWQKAPLELPAELLPAASQPSTSQAGNDSSGTAPATSRSTITAKLTTIDQAMHEVLSLSANDFLVLEGEEADLGMNNDLLAVRARVSALERADLRAKTAAHSY